MILRRLLVDQSGDIARLWKLEGRSGQPRIIGGVDLQCLPHRRGLAFATADRVELTPTLQLDAFFMWRDDEYDEEEVSGALEAADAPDGVPLRKYVEGVCLVYNEKPIRRLDLITYICNNRGGARFDRRGRAGDPRRRAAHELLDQLREEELPSTTRRRRSGS